MVICRRVLFAVPTAANLVAGLSYIGSTDFSGAFIAVGVVAIILIVLLILLRVVFRENRISGVVTTICTALFFLQLFVADEYIDPGQSDEHRSGGVCRVP